MDFIRYFYISISYSICCYLQKKRKAKMAAGLQIFNSTGKIVFDSTEGDRYASIVSTYTIRRPSGSGRWSGNYTDPAVQALVNKGMTPFFIIAPGRWFLTDDYTNISQRVWMNSSGRLSWQIDATWGKSSLLVMLGAF